MVQNRDLLSTRICSSTNRNESIVRKMFVNLRDFGPIEEPDMKYLKERQKKFGWEGLLPSRLSDQALLSLVWDMRYPHRCAMLHCSPAKGWTNAAALFAVNSIVFSIDPSGSKSKLAVTDEGMSWALEFFQSIAEYELISRITGRSLLINPTADAETMREFARDR